MKHYVSQKITLIVLYKYIVKLWQILHYWILHRNIIWVESYLSGTIGLLDFKIFYAWSIKNKDDNTFLFWSRHLHVAEVSQNWKNNSLVFKLYFFNNKYCNSCLIMAIFSVSRYTCIMFDTCLDDMPFIYCSIHILRSDSSFSTFIGLHKRKCKS